MLYNNRIFWVELIFDLPKWTQFNVGRVVFNLKNNQIYIGSGLKEKRWILLGGQNTITNNQINWNNQFKVDNIDTIDAYDIPIKLDSFDSTSLMTQCFDDITNVGSVLDYFNNFLHGLFEGRFLPEHFISCLNINTNIDGLNSKCIPVYYDFMYGEYYRCDDRFVSVEDVLLFLKYGSKHATSILVETPILMNAVGLDSTSFMTAQRGIDIFDKYISSELRLTFKKLDDKIDKAPIYQQDVVTVLQRLEAESSSFDSFVAWKILHASHVHATRYIHENCIINYEDFTLNPKLIFSLQEYLQSLDRQVQYLHDILHSYDKLVKRNDKYVLIGYVVDEKCTPHSVDFEWEHLRSKTGGTGGTGNTGSRGVKGAKGAKGAKGNSVTGESGEYLIRLYKTVSGVSGGEIELKRCDCSGNTFGSTETVNIVS